MSDDGDEKTFYDIADELVASTAGKDLAEKIAEALEAAYIRGEHQMIDMIRRELNKQDLRVAKR